MFEDFLPHPAIAIPLIAIVTVIVSMRAFVDHRLQDRLIFSTESVLCDKEYYRCVTSAFLHADWSHLIFNMISFLLFGLEIERAIGPEKAMLIYFTSVVGGSLLSLYLHRHHDYSALGASGGVCGIIFSFIFLFPGSSIGAGFLPIMIPGWLYAIIFLIAEFYAGRKKRTNIGHDAHLGGAILGLLTATALFPTIVKQQPYLYAAVMAIASVMFLYFLKNPLDLPLKHFFDISFSAPKTKGSSAEQIDAVLDKVSKKGIRSLSDKERCILKNASKAKR